jgi:hypothetical protein
MQPIVVFDGASGSNSVNDKGPTDCFRVRHDQPFSAEAFGVFVASCSIFRARIEAHLAHWSAIPSTKAVSKPSVSFFPPELSADRRVMSLPVRVQGQTIGSRSLLQLSAAAELHVHLPPPLWLEVEIGVTEPGFEDPRVLRHDWWDPKRPMQPPTPGMVGEIRQKGGRVVTGEKLFDVLPPVYGWRWIKRRLCRSFNRWCRDE